MRARRREINIFNMSLLDILCGALGAFCFMMLVALPYYIPPGSGLELRKAQEETDRLLLAIGNMKDRLPDQKSVEEMEALMQQLEAQVKTLQGRVNMLTAEREEMQVKMKKLVDENEDLRGQLSEMGADNLLLQQTNKELKAKNDAVLDENKKLTAKNDTVMDANKRLTALLERKKTFVVAAHSPEFIDLLLTDELSDLKKERGPNEGFDRWLKGEMQTSMLHSFLSVSGSSAEIRTATPEKPQKIFVKLNTPARTSGITQVEGAIFTVGHEDRVMRWPDVKLSTERFWALIGTITTDPDNQLKFNEASAEERDAEWQALTNEAPPPAPTPTPPPSAEAQASAAAARAKRQEFGRKFSELLRLQNMPAKENETEFLRLADELLKELPPHDAMRRQVESLREHTLMEKARRGRAQPSASPTP